MRQLLLIVVFIVVSCCLMLPYAGGQNCKRRHSTTSELLIALRMEKFEGLPDSILTDIDVLVNDLKSIIDKPSGESKEESLFIRRRAIIALGMYGGAKSVSRLRDLVKDEDEEFRRDAIVALGRTKTKDGVALAIVFLRHSDELFREAAIDALGASDRQDALDALKVLDVSTEKPFIIRKHREMIDKLTAAIVSQSLHP